MIRYHAICCLALLCMLSPTARADEDIFQIGVEALRKGNERFAGACFYDVTREQPKNAEGFNRRGLAYHYLNEYNKAIEDFSEAIHLDPKLVTAHANRGLAHYAKGNYDEGIKDMDEAIRLDPKFAD